jgi:hypothetical protein
MSTDAAHFIRQAWDRWYRSTDVSPPTMAEAIAAALEGHAVIDGQVVKVEQRGEWDPCCADGAYGPCGCGKGDLRTFVEVRGGES